MTPHGGGSGSSRIAVRNVPLRLLLGRGSGLLGRFLGDLFRRLSLVVLRGGLGDRGLGGRRIALGADRRRGLGVARLGGHRLGRRRGGFGGGDRRRRDDRQGGHRADEFFH